MIKQAIFHNIQHWELLKTRSWSSVLRHSVENRTMAVERLRVFLGLIYSISGLHAELADRGG